jgi:chaperone modulatory protein CbpM
MSTELMTVSCNELIQSDFIKAEFIIEIVDYGIVKPLSGENSATWIFETSSVQWLRKAIRLHKDLDFDWIAVSFVIELMQEKECLERENKRIKQQLGRFMPNL